MKRFLIEQVRRVLVSKEIEAETAEDAIRRFEGFRPGLGDCIRWFLDQGRKDRPAKILSIVELGETNDEHGRED